MKRQSSSGAGRSERLEKAVDLLQKRHGPRAVARGDTLSRIRPAPPHAPTGFAALDALTGCGGIPMGAITLLSGQTTSGKLTIAYKALVHLQRAQRGAWAALLDLSRTADPDYLARCGVALDRLALARPTTEKEAVAMLVDLARSRQVAAVLVDGLPELTLDPAAARLFEAALPQLSLSLDRAPCAVICLDEPRAPWLQRWMGRDRSSALAHHAALQIELRRERWIEQDGELRGYQAQARLIKSRWARSGQSAPVAILFNGSVRAQPTW